MDKLAKYELEVLRMVNGDIPVAYGAWVNATGEYLLATGYLEHRPADLGGGYALTKKGIKALKGDKNEKKE